MEMFLRESTGRRWIPLTKRQGCQTLMIFFVASGNGLVNKWHSTDNQIDSAPVIHIWGGEMELA